MIPSTQSVGDGDFTGQTAFAVPAEVIENVAARVQIDESARQKVVALPRAGTADDRRNLKLKSNNREK
jgi:hypothetical protein